MPAVNRRFGAAMTIAVLVVIGVAAVVAWRYLQAPQLPPGFASGNGRLEATEYDVASKLAGRLLIVSVHEGDNVSEGQVLARIDTADLEAALNEAQAQWLRAVAAEKQARALVKQRESDYAFARKTAARSRAVLAKGLTSKDAADRDEANQQSAAAALDAARAGLDTAAAAIEVAHAASERIRVNIADGLLRSPVNGRVLYRLAEPGEIVGAGGKVLTLIDLSDVYMPIFLPTEQAGRVHIGAAARIVFDALPDKAIAAHVSFVAPQAQFTPKEVETKTEREKLMFRVKVKVDREVLIEHADVVKSGVPGVSYIQLDPSAAWPQWLPPLLATAQKASTNAAQ
ncbi:MAG TPA: HlyD family efflux transporter periplasmic adaptor subunit [Spongiibacteraceae bacterium]|nr:HlyD family efflux transporter periplasmic adaptor subunit [Spongiibacteraceae bacterium]